MAVSSCLHHHYLTLVLPAITSNCGFDILIIFYMQNKWLYMASKRSGFSQRHIFFYILNYGIRKQNSLFKREYFRNHVPLFYIVVVNLYRMHFNMLGLASTISKLNVKFQQKKTKRKERKGKKRREK